MSLLYIGLGGFLGACFRYLNGEFLTGILAHLKVPYPTLITNLLACFAFGLLFPLAEHYSWFSENLRRFVFVGFLGGFSTYSSFMFEMFALLEKGNWLICLQYLFLHLGLGILVVWLGILLGLKLI